jgi:hypothetical protein
MLLMYLIVFHIYKVGVGFTSPSEPMRHPFQNDAPHISEPMRHPFENDAPHIML